MRSLHVTTTDGVYNVVPQRLAGARDWRDSFNMMELVLSAGGSLAYLSQRHSKERKFILEQFICVEVIGTYPVCLLTRRIYPWLTVYNDVQHRSTRLYHRGSWVKTKRGSLRPRIQHSVRTTLSSCTVSIERRLRSSPRGSCCPT